jgi:hypothetical protein
MALENDIHKIISKDVFNENAPDYEKQIRTRMLGYNLVIKFPNNNNPEENSVSFPAYITRISDKFNSSYSDERIYGRMDPIPVYSNTSRVISFDLSLPSNGLEHSRLIAKKLNILTKNVYPIYEKFNSVNVISSAPLAALFFSNFIYDSSNNGYLLGYFNGGIDITHDLTKGTFARGAGYEVYPKAYNLNFSFTVLHSFTPGYVKGQNNGPITNPVNILNNALPKG